VTPEPRPSDDAQAAGATRPRAGPTLENRLPAEGINSSTEHPLREFAWLVGGSLALFAAVALLIGWGARWLAPLVPFAAEQALAERVVDAGNGQPPTPRDVALQSLADRLAARMDLPPGMSVQVRADDSPTLNAYATIGGRIRVHDGLLRHLQSEDALAALLAHEIAHVKHRHVAAQLGRDMAVSLLLAAVWSDAGSSMARSAMGQTAGLVSRGYSRDQEAEADGDALAAVVALYGHAGGLVALFDTLNAQAPASSGPEMLSTHPLTSARIAAALARARAAGWRTEGPSTPLPEALKLPR